MKNSETQVIRIKAEPTWEDANAVIEECRERIQAYGRNEMTKIGMINAPICDLTFGLLSIGSGNPYREIINEARFISCALADAWFFFFEAERLRRELADLKGRTVEIVDAELLADTSAIDELIQEATAHNNTSGL